MKQRLFSILALGFLLYIGTYIYIYLSQEYKFASSSLPEGYQFEFDYEFEELNIETENEGHLNGLLFKSDSSRGVVLFLKGNGGTLKNWGGLAPVFLTHNFDVLIYDYRQHGKSLGKISQDNFYSDAQHIYEFLKSRYTENEITLVGYSLGTTIASRLSTTNEPNRTILIEPKIKFLVKIFDQIFFLFPSVNRFRFSTLEDVSTDETPISIIVGTKSGLNQDARELKRMLKENDHFYEIQGANHQTILGHTEFKKILFKALNSKYP